MNFIFISFLDIPVQGQIGFQDAATAVMHGIVNLHHHIFFFLIIVCIFVFYIFLRTYKFSVLRETLPLVYLFLTTYALFNLKREFFTKNIPAILTTNNLISLKTLVK